MGIASNFRRPIKAKNVVRRPRFPNFFANSKIFRGTAAHGGALLWRAEGSPPAPTPMPFVSKAPHQRGFFFAGRRGADASFNSGGEFDYNAMAKRNYRAACGLSGSKKRHGDRMFERLLEPGCTESPACQCGNAMDIASIEVLPEGSDAAVRVYRCSSCEREMRLTVWATLPSPAEDSAARWL